MKKLKMLLLVAVLSVFNSCRQEIEQPTTSTNNVGITDATVKNGRLYFPNNHSELHLLT